MTFFVDFKSVRYKQINSDNYYFDDNGILFRGKGKRIFVQRGSSKYLTLEMKSVKKILGYSPYQNEKIKQLILSYGLPVIYESKEQRHKRYLKYESRKKLKELIK